MKKFYTRLRMQMILNGVDQSELARRLGRSEAYISYRMAGKGPWTLVEACRMAALLPGADGTPLPLDELFPVEDVLRGERGRAV